MRSLVVAVFCVWPIAAQTVSVPLSVESGVPLRLYLTQRLSMRVGDVAVAKLIEPVYAFDRVVIPAGVEVRGNVTQLDPAPVMVRAQAILNGDFTPLHRARVDFTSVLLPDGRSLPIHTISSEGLPTLYTPPKPPKNKKTATQGAQPQVSAPAGPTDTSEDKPEDKPGLINMARQEVHLARQQAKQQINSGINSELNSRTYGLGSVVRGPNKKERLQEWLFTKLPYHPQWYREGTRFDAVLDEPIDMGTIALPADSLRRLGTEAVLNQAVEVRFLSTVSSATAKTGDPVEAVLSAPLLGADHKLVLPEGTRLTGTVRQASHARWLHRTGKLRFTFDRVDLPTAVASLPPAETLKLVKNDPPNEAPDPLESVNARLESAETDPSAHVKIDSEGSAKATESRKRLIGPAISTLIALESMDRDTGKSYASGGANGSGAAQALGGFSGFGVLGMAAGRISATAGSALGMYGMAFSVYNGIVTPGHEVEFDKNSSMVVRFGPRPAPGASKKPPESH